MPGSSKKKDILVIPEPGLYGALLAEPVLRALTAGDAEAAITVCHEFADLFAGHPAVHALAYTYPEQGTAFDQILTLQAEQEKGTAMDKIFDYATATGVSLPDRRPTVFLNSFDLLRAQRFGLSKLPSPRAAVALPALLDPAEEAAWGELCRTLTERMECGVVLLGPEEGGRIATGRDLRGKLMARETAAVVSRCDVLISPDAEMVWMAAAVRVPGIFVGDPETARLVCPGTEQGIVEYAACPEDVIGALSRLREQLSPREETGNNGDDN